MIVRRVRRVSTVARLSHCGVSQCHGFGVSSYVSSITRRAIRRNGIVPTVGTYRVRARIFVPHGQCSLYPSELLHSLSPWVEGICQVATVRRGRLEQSQSRLDIYFTYCRVLINLESPEAWTKMWAIHGASYRLDRSRTHEAPISPRARQPSILPFLSNVK